MAALSAARMTESRNLGVKRRYKMAASTQIYKGGIVMLNSSGLAVPATAAASNQGCVGIATEDKLSGTATTLYITVDEGEFLLAGTTLADTSVGLVVYAEDDQTVDETQSTNEPIAGKLVEVESATAGWVAMGLAFSS